MNEQEYYTVKELITELEKHDMDAPVGLHKKGCKYDWLCTRIQDETEDFGGWLILSGGD
jgi:hypothetical protein